MKKKINIHEILFLIICLVVMLIFLIPIFHMIYQSLWADFEDKFVGLENYRKYVFTKSTFVGMKNSLYIMVIGSFLGVMMSVIGGYVLAQQDIPGRKVLSIFILGTLVFEAGIIPTFLVIEKLNLLNTLWSVICTRSVNAVYIFYLKSVFEGVPKELIDSAKLDGAYGGVLFWKIIFPICKPAIALVHLLFMVYFWNDYIGVRLYVQKTELRTWQYSLRSVCEGLDKLWCAGRPYYEHSVCARVVFTLIPSVIWGILCSKYLDKALELGSEKK